MDRIKKILFFTAGIVAVLVCWYIHPAPKGSLYFLLFGAGFAAISLVYTAFGLKLSKLLGINEEGAVKYAAAAALSLLTAGTIVFAAGFAGFFNIYFFFSLAAVMAAISYKELVLIIKSLINAVGKMALISMNGRDTVYYGLAAVTVSYLLLIAMLPPIYYDTLVYHLAVPAQYVSQGRAFNMPENIFSYFPCLLGMNSMMFIGFADLLGPSLLQFVLAMLAALAVKETAEKLGGSGRWAFLLAVTFPLFMLNTGRVTSEMTLAFCAASMLLLFVKYPKKFGMGQAIIAAALFSVMISVKYTGIIIYGFGVFYIIYLASRKRAGLAGVLTAAIVPLVFFAPYAIRNYVWTGDPVYPFMASVFNTPESLKQAALAYVSHVNGFAVEHNFMNLFLAPFYLVYKPELFGGDAVSPLLIAGILAFFITDIRKTAMPLAFIVFYYVIWFFTGEVLRFLLPMCLALAAVTALAARKLNPKFAAVFFGLLVAVQFFTSVFLIEEYQTPFKIFEQTKDEYMSQKLTYFDAARAVSNLPDDDARSVLYLGEARTLFSDRRVIANTVFNKDFLLKDFNSISDTDTLNLLKSGNVGYIMINFDELDRLKQGGFDGTYAVVSSERFKNFIDKNFTGIYSIGKVRIFRLN